MEIHKEISSLHSVYTKNPIFGVTYEKKKKLLDQNPPADRDIDELDENQLKGLNHLFSAYVVSSAENANGKPVPVYSSEIGFAVEKPADGLKLKDLFHVII